MPDEPQGQEPTPAGQEPPTPPASAPPGSTSQEPKDPPERYDAEYVRDLRRSEAATRKRLQDAEAKAKALEDAQLSEQERKDRELTEAKAEVERMRQERRTLAIRMAVERAARRLDVVDEDVAYRLLDHDGLDDDDTLGKEVERRVQALLKDKPYLAKGSAGGRAIPETPRGTTTPETDAERQERYRKRMAESGAYGRL